jgi:hypothetical protein
MLMMPSEPSATTTTTTIPFARRPTDQPIAFTRQDHRSLEKRFIQICKVETIVLGDVGKALRVRPRQFSQYIL